MEFQRSGQVQAIGEDQLAGFRIDTQALVMRDGLLCPQQRVARVMTQAVEQLGEVQIEIAQESIHGDAVGERDAQCPTIFANPAVQRRNLAVDQPRAELLVRHDPLMGHGAHRLHIPRACQMHIAGAGEPAGKIALQSVHHHRLYGKGETTACAEIRQGEAGQFVAAGLAA